MTMAWHRAPVLNLCRPSLRVGFLGGIFDTVFFRAQRETHNDVEDVDTKTTFNCDAERTGFKPGRYASRLLFNMLMQTNDTVTPS